MRTKKWNSTQTKIPSSRTRTLPKNSPCPRIKDTTATYIGFRTYQNTRRNGEVGSGCVGEWNGQVHSGKGWKPAAGRVGTGRGTRMEMGKGRSRNYRTCSVPFHPQLDLSSVALPRVEGGHPNESPLPIGLNQGVRNSAALGGTRTSRSSCGQGKRAPVIAFAEELDGKEPPPDVCLMRFEG
jgi:hypothetical protein